jgi:hypothetical protein
MTGVSTGITFELERLEQDAPGRLLVCGRWFGVRGRRFVRPTLTMTMRSDRSERRALADLQHKPWAAEDGESWIAAFPLDVALAEVGQLELSVAPDVAVELAPTPVSTAGRPVAARQAEPPRAPRRRRGPVPGRPAAGDLAQEIERLATRLKGTERAAERAHARREEAEQALDEERSKTRRLASELGQLRGELGLAATARSELSAASAELDATRSEARDTAGRLQTAIRALDRERAETEQLRQQVAAAEATIRRLSQARETEREHAARRAAAPAPAREDVRARMPPGAAEAQRTDPLPEPVGVSLRGAATSRRAHSELHHPIPDRPINPALRSRPNWFLRVFALIVIAAVVVAIYLAIHSTIARAAGL